MLFYQLVKFLICLSLIFINLQLWATIAPPKLHVVVAQKLQTIDVVGNDLKRMLFHEKNLKKFNGSKSIKFRCQGVPPKKGLLAMVTSPSGILDWNGVKYQGDFLIVGSDQGDECALVNRTSLESYLITLLPKEMNKDWPLEALKAQAVVARSYALYKIRARKAKMSPAYYDLINSEVDQVSGSLKDGGPRSIIAVKETEGEVLASTAGELIPTFFHSKCGGRTLLPQHVWKNPVKGYQSVECPYCQRHGQSSWRHQLVSNDFNRVLIFLLKRYYKITLSPKSELQWEKDSFYKDYLTIRTQEKFYTIKKTLFRRYFGREKIPGNYLQIEKEKDRIIIRGEGNGHGVGLCQFGALHLADNGRNYKEILKYYFPQLVISQTYFK